MDTKTPSMRRVRWDLEDVGLAMKRAQARREAKNRYWKHYKRLQALRDLRHIDRAVQERKSGR